MLNRIKMLVGGGFALVVIAVGGIFALKTWLAMQQNAVIFDNTYAEAVTITVDGQGQGTIQPNQQLVVDLEPGSHEVVASGAAGELDHGTVEVADGSGFRGLYSLGGQKQYIVVRAVYSTAGGDTQYLPIPPGQKFMALPADVSPDGLNQTFPEEITTSGGSATITYVCHYDPATETIGCPNA